MPRKTLTTSGLPHLFHLVAAVGVAGLAPGCFAPDEAANNAADTDAADSQGVEGTATSSVPQTTGPATGGPTPDDSGHDTDTPPQDTADADGSGETSSGSFDEGSTSDVGGETGDPVDTDGEGETGSAGDAPSIVEITPANGSIGVHADATIVVRFSEEMDKASAQAAFQSADLPAASVTFEWNDAGDELTIVPNNPLAYAQGSSPATTDALTYGFTLTTAAESEDGEALASNTDVSFSTLRRLSAGFEDDPNLSGRVRDLGGATLIAGSYLLGDTSNNDVSRGFVSFDVSSLPPGPITVESASFHARWSQQIGNPFVDLGAVVYQHVAYDTFNDALFDVSGIGSASGLFATAQQDEVERDVTSIVEAVVADDVTYEQRVQFRMVWFFSESDGDGQSDGVTLIASDLGLDLTYLAP